MNLDEIIKNGEKKYGKGTFTYGRNVGRDFPRIPTGIFAVDYAVGGGFPITVSSSMHGPPGGGKSIIGMRACAGAQNICWHCFEYLWDCDCKEPHEKKIVIVPTEPFDMDWAILLGLDPDKAIVADPESGEQAADIIIKCLEADDCGLVMLDSLAQMVPTVEIESSIQEVQVTPQAKLITKMIRKIRNTLSTQKKHGNDVAFICTNQIRAKIGGFGFGAQETIPGGFASKHDWHLNMRMSQLKAEQIDKETDLPIYSKFKSSIVSPGNKRKVFVLAGTAEFYVTTSENAECPPGQINDYKTVMRYADSAGLLERGPWRFAGVEYDKKSDLMDQWQDDDQTFLSAKKLIIDHYVRERKQAFGIVVECANEGS